MISDEELILYYYREVDDAERARIGAALAEQPELAQRLHRLVARLDAAAAIPEVPVPAEAMQRWRTALDQAAATRTRESPAKRRDFTRAPWLAAAAAVLVAIVAIIQQREPTPPSIANVTPPPATAPATTSYERGLQSHLASTERQLASLETATPEERARLVKMIIEQNRLYALAAEKAGEPQLARVLRAFSPVLESLQQGGDTSASVDQLAFELRVMQGRLGAAPAPHTQSTTL